MSVLTLHSSEVAQAIFSRILNLRATQRCDVARELDSTETRSDGQPSTIWLDNHSVWPGLLILLIQLIIAEVKAARQTEQLL